MLLVIKLASSAREHLNSASGVFYQPWVKFIASHLQGKDPIESWGLCYQWVCKGGVHMGNTQDAVGVESHRKINNEKKVSLK
jgi:hypothetical protein